MSSTTYLAEIRANSRLRRIVMLTGLASTLIGVLVIILLPISAPGRAFGVIGWSCWCGRELLTYWRAYDRWSGFRVFADGNIELFGAGECRAAHIVAGSIVLAEVAWIRVQIENGDCWGELVAGKHRECEEWRRFQVIFRHRNTC